ncbi:response regulator [Kordiimonas marina]|uniref:response regulator n=1 Tax=Kordiimonas marina TaxID=2872312 RepID=UPI001FF4EEA2|nr:response regulator transcription factor [Kordiimonas marina]MCJ9429303.1 response regulator transcription factor [Kordiimonas marina]
MPPADQSKLSVLVVEDCEPVAERLASILHGWSRVETVAVCYTLAEAFAEIATGRTDIALVDLDLPDGSGISAIRALRRRTPDAHSIILSALSDSHVVVDAIAAGATGYVLKDDESIGVIAAITSVLEGKSPMSATIARLMVAQIQSRSQPAGTEASAPDSSLLTAREHEVLSAIARGFSYKEVANILGISAQTVPVHVRNIYRKLESSNRAEAVYEAQVRGILKV